MLFLILKLERLLKKLSQRHFSPNNQVNSEKIVVLIYIYTQVIKSHNYLYITTETILGNENRNLWEGNTQQGVANRILEHRMSITWSDEYEDYDTQLDPYRCSHFHHFHQCNLYNHCSVLIVQYTPHSSYIWTGLVRIKLSH